jgi:hypothetical protein
VGRGVEDQELCLLHREADLLGRAAVVDEGEHVEAPLAHRLLETELWGLAFVKMPLSSRLLWACMRAPFLGTSSAGTLPSSTVSVVRDIVRSQATTGA